jgi:hypothetical protein
MIAWRNPQIIDIRCRIHHTEFSSCNRLNTKWDFFGLASIPYQFRIAAGEICNHKFQILTLYDTIVKGN